MLKWRQRFDSLSGLCRPPAALLRHASQHWDENPNETQHADSVKAQRVSEMSCCSQRYTNGKRREGHCMKQEDWSNLRLQLLNSRRPTGRDEELKTTWKQWTDSSPQEQQEQDDCTLWMFNRYISSVSGSESNWVIMWHWFDWSEGRVWACSDRQNLFTVTLFIPSVKRNMVSVIIPT